MCIYKCMLNVYKNQQNRQTGSRNLMSPKTLPTIWGTYMKLVTKYQISAINSYRNLIFGHKLHIGMPYCGKRFWTCQIPTSCLPKRGGYHKWASGSRNLMSPKTLPTIWGTYMKLVTKYQISAINSYWEKCGEKYLGRTDRRTEVKQYTSSPFTHWTIYAQFSSHFSQQLLMAEIWYLVTSFI
jgi:hypothetical protein